MVAPRRQKRPAVPSRDAPDDGPARLDIESGDRRLSPPLRKPMARAGRVSLFEREVRVRLAPVGLDVLFDAAKLLTEGQVDGERYFGSTMMTIDLAGVAPRVTDDCDAACARRVVELAAADERVRERARGIAVSHAVTRGGVLDTPAVDVHVRRDGRVLHLNLDVEARRKP